MNRYEAQDAMLYQAVNGLMSGNADSYNDMYNLSIKYIYKIIYDIVQDYHTTEDLVQETYIAIYNKLNTLQDVTKFYAWAGRIATNFTLRYIQSNRRELLTLDSDEEDSDFIFDVAAQDNEAFIPENILMDKEKQRILGDIIDGLSVEQKIVIQYFYYEDMSVSEIADAMACPVGTVKSRLNYARKTIKDAVLDLDVNENTRFYSLSHVPLFLIVFREAVENFSFAEAVGVAAIGAEVIGAKATVEGAFAGEIAGQGAATVGGGVASEGAGAIGGNAVATGTINTGSVGSATATGVGGTTTTSGAMAGKAATGALSKFVGTVGGKIAIGAVTTGVLVTGGIVIHNSINDDKVPVEVDTTPMVINMESTLNTETVVDEEDRFMYEYVTITYDDETVTLGFDGEIYEYGFDAYNTLSPELKDLHEEKYDQVVEAEEEALADLFDDKIEFTIDGEKFEFYLEEVKVEYLGDEGETTYIKLIGGGVLPDNVDEIQEHQQALYDEQMAENEEQAVIEEEQTEEDALAELIKEYYMGVLEDFYIYGTDPFGNPLPARASGGDNQVYAYAIIDVDSDGWDELIVQHTEGEIVYGYNPHTSEVIEELNIHQYNAWMDKFIYYYEYYDNGYVVQQRGYRETSIYKYDPETDTYDTTNQLWHCETIYMYYYELKEEFTASDEEEMASVVSQYDTNGDGNVWLYYDDAGNPIFFDDDAYKADLEAQLAGGNVIPIWTYDITEVVSSDVVDEKKYTAYMEVVERAYLEGIGTAGIEYSDGGSDERKYAIYDINNDGEEELIIIYGEYTYIYYFEPNTKEVWESYMHHGKPKFYDNGYIGNQY